MTLIKNYFSIYINIINGEINSKLDFLTNRNIKYLLYRFNDLLTNAGIDLVRERHSQKVKNNIAIAQIQKTDWQYFINKVLDIIWSNENEDDEYSVQDLETVDDFIKNLVLTKKTYKIFYDTISNIFTLTIKNLLPEEKVKIQKDLQNNYMKLNFDSQIEDSHFLDTFCEFYFKNGCFPGHSQLIIIPRPILPGSIQNTRPIRLKDLYTSFSVTDAKALVSIQAICALLIYFAEENVQASGLARLVMNKYFDNLTAECLDETNGTKYPEFVALKNLSNSLQIYFEDMNLRSQLKEQV